MSLSKPPLSLLLRISNCTRTPAQSTSTHAVPRLTHLTHLLSSQAIPIAEQSSCRKLNLISLTEKSGAHLHLSLQPINRLQYRRKKLYHSYLAFPLEYPLPLSSPFLTLHHRLSQRKGVAPNVSEECRRRPPTDTRWTP